MALRKHVVVLAVVIVSAYANKKDSYKPAHSFNLFMVSRNIVYIKQCKHFSTAFTINAGASNSQ